MTGRSSKVERYDLGDLTREEMGMIERGLELVTAEAMNNRGPWGPGTESKLRDEITRTIEEDSL